MELTCQFFSPIKLFALFALVFSLSNCQTVRLGESALFYPVQIANYSAFDNLKEINLADSSGHLINGIELSNPVSKTVILYFHSNYGSIWEKDFESIVRNIDTLGYSMVAIDYCGYGKSTGNASIQSLYSSADITYKYVQDRYPKNRVIIWGFSLGSIPTCFLAAQGKGDKIILESGLTYDEEIISNVVKNNTKKSQRLFLKIKMDSALTFNNQENIKKTTQPFLYIHGELDKTVTIQQATINFQLTPNNNKVFYKVVGAGHNETDKNKNEYLEVVRQFVSPKQD